VHQTTRIKAPIIRWKPIEWLSRLVDNDQIRLSSLYSYAWLILVYYTSQCDGTILNGSCNAHGGGGRPPAGICRPSDDNKLSLSRGLACPASSRRTVEPRLESTHPSIARTASSWRNANASTRRTIGSIQCSSVNSHSNALDTGSVEPLPNVPRTSLRTMKPTAPQKSTFIF